MTKVFIGGGIFIFILFLGIYFLTRSTSQDDLIAQKEKIQNDLTISRERLKKEKEKLNTMFDDLRLSFGFATTTQDQMKKASDVVKQTDFMFNDPHGSSPEIIVDNPLNNIFINIERGNINSILREWQKKTDLLSIKSIDVGEGEKIKKDAETIKTFIQDLSLVVSSLTPKNSGLSQFQINAYLSQLSSIVLINQVLASLETAIQNAKIDNSQIPNAQNDFPVYNSQTFPSSPSNTTSNISTVAPEDVVAQQKIVAEVQAQTTALQDKLVEIQQQIQPVPPFTVQTETNTTTSTNSTNQNQNNSNNSTGVYSPRQITPQGIIIQPGPPQLIQGTDPF